jgi:16S rRNA processing protein RimM
MSERASRLVIVGRVAGAYGVRGWIKVVSATEPPEAILDYAVWRLCGDGGAWHPRTLLAGRLHGKGVLARLADCEDRDTARALIGATVAVPRSEMPDPGPGRFYWADLEGLAVKTTAGAVLGVVDHLIETGANDVLVVRGERERLIPYAWDAVVKAVDLDQGVMTVDWDPEF